MATLGGFSLAGRIPKGPLFLFLDGPPRAGGTWHAKPQLVSRPRDAREAMGAKTVRLDRDPQARTVPLPCPLR